MNVQIIEQYGKPAFAVLPIEEYNKIRELLEDAGDAAAYNRIAADIESGREELFPQELVDALVEGQSPVRLFREFRRMTPAQLAEKCGVSPAHIYQIESGKRSMSVALLRKLVQVLNVDADLLI